MAKVNFYLLKEQEHAARQRLACRLAEQQARQGNRVYLQCGDGEECQALDKLLWEFPAESFVPHALAGAAAAANTLVTIGTPAHVPANTYCLLNLCGEPVATAGTVSVIAEFVLNDEGDKARSRQLWQRYKQQGFELQFHQL